MEQNEQKDIGPLIKKRDALRHRMFLLILEIALWFGVPAFGAFFLGNYMDTRYDTGHRYLLTFLVVAFVLSWVAIIWRTKTLSRKLTEAEKEVRDFKETQK